MRHIQRAHVFFLCSIGNNMFVLFNALFDSRNRRIVGAGGTPLLFLAANYSKHD